MKKLKLSKGAIALVDDADYPLVSQYKWSIDNLGYACNHKMGRLHRFLMNPPHPLVVDHINGVKTDNRRSNLQICSRAFNAHKVVRRRSNSLPKGVHLHRCGKYRAVIKRQGKYISIGFYDDPDVAALAYELAARVIYEKEPRH